MAALEVFAGRHTGRLAEKHILEASLETSLEIPASKADLSDSDMLIKIFSHMQAEKPAKAIKSTQRAANERSITTDEHSMSDLNEQSRASRYAQNKIRENQDVRKT